MRVYVVTYNEYFAGSGGQEVVGVWADLNSAMRYVHERYQVMEEFVRTCHSPITWKVDVIPDDGWSDCTIEIVEHAVSN